MKRTRTSAFILAFLFLSTNLFAQNVSVGETTPGFEVDQLGGGTLTPEAYRGMILVLYFVGSY